MLNNLFISSQPLSISPVRFIEYGEYKGNYYGTSLDSIRSVLSKNKVCLLDVQPHVSPLHPILILPSLSSLYLYPFPALHLPILEVDLCPPCSSVSCLMDYRSRGFANFLYLKISSLVCFLGGGDQTLHKWLVCHSAPANPWTLFQVIQGQACIGHPRPNQLLTQAN